MLLQWRGHTRTNHFVKMDLHTPIQHIAYKKKQGLTMYFKPKNLDLL